MTAPAFVYDAVRTPRGEGQRTGSVQEPRIGSIMGPAILLGRAVPAGSLRAAVGA